MIPMLGACLLSLASCGDKEPGSDAVATVNGYEITTAELNHELAQQGVANAQDPAAARAALEAIVNRKLLADLATERELDRTPEIILAEQRLREQLLANAAIRILAPPGRAPDSKEVTNFVANLEEVGRQRTIFQIQGLRFAVPSDQAVMRSLEQAQTFEAVAQALERAKVPTQPSNLTWDSAAMPSELVRQLDALPEGEPFVIAQPEGALAGVIRQKQSQALTAEQARELGNAAVGQQAVTRAVSEWLQGARASAEIIYGEGYEPEAEAGAQAEAQPAQ
jgi:EpsD family peptidyl-prolyl cis-trans isomerase